MVDIKKYQVGDTFKSTRSDEGFVIIGYQKTHETSKTVKGKKIPVENFSYLIAHIPEVRIHEMPNGKIWEHKLDPFISHDEVIDREITQGNWVISE